MNKVTITSQASGGYAHDLQTRTHTIVSDLTIAEKGTDRGPTPKELALMALGACAAMTVRWEANRLGISIGKVSVTVSDGTTTDPDDATKTVAHVVESIEVEGTFTEDQLAKLKSAGKNCPVNRLFVRKKVVEATITAVAPPSATAETSAATTEPATANTDTPSAAAEPAPAAAASPSSAKDPAATAAIKEA